MLSFYIDEDTSRIPALLIQRPGGKHLFHSTLF